MPSRFLAAASLALASLAATSLADAAAPAPASFVVVHGIPGRDVAASLDPLLPVDVLIGGSICLLKNFNFGEIAGPFSVPAGKYSVAISLADPIKPCSNAPVISATADLTPGAFASVVAALSPEGMPTADIFGIDASSVPKGQQRLIAAHAADAPAVKVTATGLGAGKESLSFTLAPQKEKAATVPAQPGFAISATAASGGPVVLGPADVSAGKRSVVLLYAVGSAASGSITLLSKILPDVF